MDIGAVIALIDLVYRCYSRCKPVSDSFSDLHLDLLSLHAALLSVRPFLLGSGDYGAIHIGCEKIVNDIGALLSKHDSLGTTKKRLWQRFSWHSADIAQLRSRLTAQVGMLHLYVSAINSPVQGTPHTQNHSEPPMFSQSVDSSGGDDKQIWNAIHQELRNLEPPPDTSSSSGSIEPLIDIDNSQNPPFAASLSTLSNSACSVTSSEKGYSSLTSTLKAKLMRPRSNFIAAAKGGDVTTLLKIVEDRVQRSQLNQKSINKALIAVSSNEKRGREQIQVIELLLNRNAELEYKDSRYGRTPLIWAVTVGREDIMDVLLDNQALIEAKDEIGGWTPLMWAVWWGNEAIIKRLIDRGACLKAIDNTFERTPLLWAAKRGTYGAAAILLQRNRELIEVKDKEQLTPLVLAYVEGHEAVAKVLLDHGADPNSNFPSGMPLLISAVAAGDSAFVQLLVNKGADVNCKNREGIPALSIAVREEHPSIVKFLIARGAPLEARDSQGRTALLWAVGRARGDLLELLVRSGADRCAADDEGRTAREWAELTEDGRIVELVSSSKKG